MKKLQDEKKIRKEGDFTNLKGCRIEEALDAIPDNAIMIPFKPSMAITDGIKFNWTQDGHQHKWRAHSQQKNAPIGSNSSMGWTMRIQKDHLYFDGVTNTYIDLNSLDKNSSEYNKKVNDTHIPVIDPYSN